MALRATQAHRVLTRITTLRYVSAPVNVGLQNAAKEVRLSIPGDVDRSGADHTGSVEEVQ